MESIGPITLAAATPVTGLLPRAVPVQAERRQSAPAEPQVLEPAVSIEVGRDAPSAPVDEALRKIVRDLDTQSLVYRVTDSVSGDLIVQFPDAMVLKARAYAQQTAAIPGEHVERSA